MERGIRYQAVGDGDVAWLADAYLTSLREAITEVRGGWDEARERDQFLRQLRLADTRMLVVAGAPAGFYTAWPASGHWFVGTLCMIPSHQRRGLGAAAMHEIARQAHGLPVQLSVLKSNRAARRFYERLGCRHVSSTQHHDHFTWPVSAQCA